MIAASQKTQPLRDKKGAENPAPILNLHHSLCSHTQGHSFCGQKTVASHDGLEGEGSAQAFA